MATQAPKTTVNVGGVPYTATSAAKAQALASKDAPAPVAGGPAPARGDAGWVDPIRAAGDTTFSAKYGTPTPAELANANDPSAVAPSPTSPTTATPTDPVQAPTSPQVATTAQNQLPGSLNAASPVTTNAAAPTPTQNKYATGMQAAVNSGAPPPVDAGAARTAVTAFTPADQPDTSVVDSYMSQDPGINNLMKGITDLLSSKNQTSSLMDDYNKLYKSSGLADINTEMINADAVINGTEDDVRNEIQKAGGFGTESQVQAMTLARNKSLIARYNTLAQMKTDATNQLNTMMQFDQADKQMAQQKIDSQISTMFNMANFRQTALQNTRQQQQYMISTMGADGYYASVSQDPRQLAMAEQILGVAPGGLQKVAVQAAQSRALDIQQKNAAINASYASAAASRANAAESAANAAKTNYELQQSMHPAGAPEGVTSADNALTAVQTAQKQVSGLSSGIVSNLTGWTGLNTSKNNLEGTLSTLKANLAFSELQKMRAASPTGGALGSISDAEENLLSSTVANLNTSQSPGQLKANLGLVQQHYVNYLTSLGYGYDEKTGTIITP